MCEHHDNIAKQGQNMFLKLLVIQKPVHSFDFVYNLSAGRHSERGPVDCRVGSIRQDILSVLVVRPEGIAERFLA